MYGDRSGEFVFSARNPRDMTRLKRKQRRGLNKNWSKRPITRKREKTG